MPDQAAVIEHFQAWCEELAAPKARNAVPGEPAPPHVNAVFVSARDLVNAYVRLHPDCRNERDALADAAEGLGGGIDCDRSRWESADSA